MTLYLHGVHETVVLGELEASSTFLGAVIYHTLTEHSTEQQFQVLMTWWLLALKLLLCILMLMKSLKRFLKILCHHQQSSFGKLNRPSCGTGVIYRVEGSQQH